MFAQNYWINQTFHSKTDKIVTKYLPGKKFFKKNLPEKKGFQER